MMKNNNNNVTITNNKKSIITSKVYTFPNYHNSQQNIAKWKDPRLELVEIPKGLIEVLQDSGFTIEKILDCGPSHIAEILAIDDYIGELIYQETKKATRNIISNSNF